MSHASTPQTLKMTAATIVAVVVLYGVMVWRGQPAVLFQAVPGTHAGEAAAPETPVEQAAPGEPAAAGQETTPHAAPPAPPLWMVVPFVLLLLAIAVLPLVPATSHWWESNLHRFYLAAGLGLATLIYYLLFHAYPIDAHWPTHHLAVPSEGGLQIGLAWTVLANALLNEYVPFIVLLFSLYAISGGIRIEGDLAAHPTTNATIIGIGGLLASFIGTTGAAMLLIRLLLETNRERKHVAHTVIVFIFVVCNCGGCLLPIGDPPLFLGYLRGVHFLWTFQLWKEWLVVNLALLAVYWVWDHYWYYPHETKRDIQRDERLIRRVRFNGVGLGGLLLAGVVLSVALLDPSKPVPGTDWHPWMYLREVVQLGLVAASLGLGSYAVRSANRFNFHAILEVAALFSGIFICMQPALQILHAKGPDLAITEPAAYFWITGGLSSVLDNAPTYVVFFELAGSVSTPGPGTVAGVNEPLLVAVSLGAVFMGSMTYIGNGPNFMVKALAETAGVRMPSFFGYMKYSLGILLPILAACCYLFLR